MPKREDTSFIKKYWAWILPYSLFLIVGLFILLRYSKTDIHLFINQRNDHFFDFFFKYITEFGTFLLIAPIIVWMGFIKYKYALMAVFSTLTATILVQILKRFVWSDSPRPKVVFRDIYPLHVVENVRLNSSHSFPSGHTAGAFALFVLLALLCKRPLHQFLCLVMAMLVGYSRMYLSQHFLIDVYVGSMVGTTCALLSYYWLLQNKSGLLDKAIPNPLKSSKH